MDDDKSIAAMLGDALSKATDTVKSTMSNLVDTASQAAQYAMESNAERISGQPVAELAPQQLTAMTDQRVNSVEAADAIMPAPLVFAQPVPVQKRKPRARKNLAKVPAAKRPAAPKAAGRPAKKTGNGKTAKKTAGKAARKAVAKNAKKASKRASAKSTAKKAAKKAKPSAAKKKRSKR